MTQTRTKIGLLGENVSKSLSPGMQNAAFRHLNLPYTYEPISVAASDFETKFAQTRESFLGLNITIPYKETALAQLNHVSGRVRKLEAVNTVLFRENESWGENTDVDGLIHAVRTSGHSIDPEKSAFIVGAGGAARASIEGLSSVGIQRFVLTTRSSDRLRELQDWFSSAYTNAELKGFLLGDSTVQQWNHELQNAAMFVNAAPLDARGTIPFFHDIRFPNGILTVEWVYTPTRTPWVMKGEEAKGTLVHGYKLLLYQGMKSFEIWTGRIPPEKIMEEALLEQLQ